MVRKIYRLLIALALLVAVCVYIFPRQRMPVGNVSAVQVSAALGVYWDVNCTQTVDSIAWENVSVGETKEVTVYVRNEWNETVFLILAASNFVPAVASDYLRFAYTCVGHRLKANEVARVAQDLFVSPDTKGVSNFSFDVNFEARPYVVGDLNGNGVVNLEDALILSAAYRSTVGDANWNADADLNEDGSINIYDALILSAKI